MDVLVTDHGARGDGVTHDTVAIQSAIDACASSGGGRVVLPAGHTWLSGSLQLRSHVTLHVEGGAVLANCEHWEHITARQRVGALSAGVVVDHTEESGTFLWAQDAEDIAITGQGVIDGGGRHYVLENLGESYRMPNERPFCVFLLRCRDVQVREVHLRDSALWTLRLTGCEDVIIDGVTIVGDRLLPNADGIDVDACRRVVIANCLIDTPDDAISIKTCEEFDCGPAEDIAISNCVLRSRSSAVVVGVDASDPIRRVSVTGCVVRPSHRGLSVNMGQASRYEDIIFSDIVVESVLDDDVWWGCGEPIYVSAAPWHDEVGTVEGVVFDTIRCTGENSIFLDAVAPGLVRDITLRNVSLDLRPPASRAGGRYDRRPWSGDAPLFEHATAGIYANNIDGLVLDGCRVRMRKAAPHAGAPLEITGCPDVEIRSLRSTTSR